MLNGLLRIFLNKTDFTLIIRIILKSHWFKIKHPAKYLGQQSKRTLGERCQGVVYARCPVGYNRLTVLFVRSFNLNWVFCVTVCSRLLYLFRTLSRLFEHREQTGHFFKVAKYRILDTNCLQKVDITEINKYKGLQMHKNTF